MVKVSDGDACYLLFADYAAASPEDCLPALSVVHRTRQWAVTHVERLDPLDAASSAALDAWWVALVAAWRSGGPLPPPAEWTDLATRLRPIAAAGGCGFDMKPANAMRRGASVVFIDPLN